MFREGPSYFIPDCRKSRRAVYRGCKLLHSAVASQTGQQLKHYRRELDLFFLFIYFILFNQGFKKKKHPSNKRVSYREWYTAAARSVMAPERRQHLESRS